MEHAGTLAPPVYRQFFAQQAVLLGENQSPWRAVGSICSLTLSFFDTVFFFSFRLKMDPILLGQHFFSNFLTHGTAGQLGWSGSVKGAGDSSWSQVSLSAGAKAEKKWLVAFSCLIFPAILCTPSLPCPPDPLVHRLQGIPFP